ncbi:sterol glucosyltransferase [Penicillium brevicompactum]
MMAQSDLSRELPPSYDVAVSGDYMELSTSTRDDGRIDVTFLEKEPGLDYLLQAIGPPERQPPPEIPFEAVIPLNIVIHIVGSRGDVQPFVALGSRLRRNGHRVRLATHGKFKDFVQKEGLEFFQIGGNPEELMSFMVKNPGIIPKMSTIASGEIGHKRQMIAEILDGCWRSCVEPDPDTKIPFVANAIIANPPSFAHIHCAQALGVPLHIMFTMPWSPTREFPHPLANIKGSETNASVNNYMSYSMVELLTWSGLADIINKWRVQTLNLEKLSTRTASGMMEALEIPHTYCWSPALIKKPADWPLYIDVCGFFFREEPSYEPSPEIVQFIRSGPTPVYIGFGSIVMDDPVIMTSIIQGACQKLGIRAIVSKGWSKLGKDCDVSNILFIDDCPHEWLFKHVAAVVHHGGAGTTACSLLNGCPTAIVPFFGDQPFWASMVAAAGAGPPPIDRKTLTTERLAEAIGFCLTPTARHAASSIAALMRSEEGTSNAAMSFHRHIPWKEMQCDLLPSEIAVWTIGRKKLKVSHRAMAILSQNQKIDMQHTKLYRSKELRIDKVWTDPLTSTSGALFDTITSFSKGLGNVTFSPAKGMSQMTSSLIKGTLVEVPTALTEGFRNIPRLYGDRPKDIEPIDDWRSGLKQAGKGLYTGFADGLTGFVTKPYRDARIDGAPGFARGFAKGSVELFSKPGAAIFGLMAYPSMGIYKSLKKANLSSTEATILDSQIALGAFTLQQNPASASEIDTVLSNFKRLI